jgi:hypothetical protein
MVPAQSAGRTNPNTPAASPEAQPAMQATRGTPCFRFLPLLTLGLLLIGSSDAFAPFSQCLTRPSRASDHDRQPRDSASKRKSKFQFDPPIPEGRINRLSLLKKAIAAQGSASIHRDQVRVPTKSIPPWWMFWRRGCFTSKACTAIKVPLGLVKPKGPASWVRRVGQAAAAVLVFVALRPLKAVAGGGGFGGGSKANMPPLERCVRWINSLRVSRSCIVSLTADPLCLFFCHCNSLEGESSCR